MSEAGTSVDGLSRLEPAPPCVLGAYELEAEAGRGGWGIVYKARHRASGNPCALKVIHAGVAVPGDAAARGLAHAVAAAAALDHPGIVRVHELASAGGRVCLEMEWVDGSDLERWLPTRRLSPWEVARLFRGVVEGVAHAHEHGVYHLELKPSNVLMDASGRARVTGLGLARGVRLGGEGMPGRTSPDPSPYAAPERVSAQYGEPRAVTDVFGLGGLLYFLLTDRPPFRGGGSPGAAPAVLGEDPPAPGTLRAGIPGELEVICLRCLEKRPSRRYASARDVLADVDRFLAGKGSLAPGGGIARVAAGWLLRSWPWWAGALVVAGLAWWRSSHVVLESQALVVRERALRRDAELGRARAEEEAGKARRERYAAQVRLAFEALNHGVPEAGLEALGREDASPGGRGLRGWEWGFLSRWCGEAAALAAGGARGPGTEGAPRTGGVFTLAFTNASAGVVSAGLTGDGTRAWAATASGMQAWDVPGARLLHEVASDAEAMESALWMDREGTAGWVVRSWVGGRLGVRSLDGEGATRTVEEAGWRPVPRYSGATGMRLSQDGRRLVVADVANGVRVWEVPGLVLTRSFPGFAARTAELSPSGDVVAAADGGGNVRLWGVAVTNEVATVVKEAQELAFGMDGRRLLAGTLDGWVRVLDAGTGREVAACGPAGAAVLAMAMDAEGRRVGAGLSDGRVVIWDVGTGEVLGTLRPGLGSVQALRFLGRDGLALAAVGGVRVYRGTGDASVPR